MGGMGREDAPTTSATEDSQGENISSHGSSSTGQWLSRRAQGLVSCTSPTLWPQRVVSGGAVMVIPLRAPAHADAGGCKVQSLTRK